MGKRVEEHSGIDGARLRALERRLAVVAPEGRWWPYKDPLHIAVSAVLTQRTTWGSAAAAMAKLEGAGLLTAPSLARAPAGRIEACIRGAGFYRQKARALKEMGQRLVDRFEGRIENAFKQETEELRKELLAWRGVGDETADAILLYGADRPVFVVDAYTVRIMRRFGAIRPGARPSYGEVARAWQAAGASGVDEAGRAHGALVEVAKVHCRPVPHCGGCPLNAKCARIGISAALQEGPSRGFRAAPGSRSSP